MSSIESQLLSTILVSLTPSCFFLTGEYTYRMTQEEHRQYHEDYARLTWKDWFTVCGIFIFAIIGFFWVLWAITIWQHQETGKRPVIVETIRTATSSVTRYYYNP